MSDKLLGSVFCAWLAVFWLGYWLGNPVPAVVGNRPLKAFPDKSLGVFSSAWLQGLSAWGIDHSPFRLRTIVERNKVLLKTAEALQPVPVCPGNSDVCMGRDGWLFLLDEALEEPTRRKYETMVEQSLKIARAVTTSGRKFCLMPIPNKSSVYPEQGGTLMRWAVDVPLRERSWSMMEQGFKNAADVSACYLPLWPVYAEARKSTPGLLYWEEDTHWNADGMVIGIHHLLEHLQPGLWDAAAVQPDGMHEHVGDLSYSLLLQPGTKLRPAYRIARPTPVKVESLTLPDFGFANISRFQSSDPRCFKGRTLVITDSFIDGAAPLLAPWFEDVTFAHFTTTGSPELAERISQCDTLIFTSVERFLRWRMGVWGSRRFDYLTKALGQHPHAHAAP